MLKNELDSRLGRMNMQNSDFAECLKNTQPPDTHKLRRPCSTSYSSSESNNFVTNSRCCNCGISELQHAAWAARIDQAQTREAKGNGRGILLPWHLLQASSSAKGASFPAREGESHGENGPSMTNSKYCLTVRTVSLSQTSDLRSSLFHAVSYIHRACKQCREIS